MDGSCTLFDVNQLPRVPKLLVFGDLGRKEFRLWWENLTEAIRERAVVEENLIFWLSVYRKSHTPTKSDEISSETGNDFSESGKDGKSGENHIPEEGAMQEPDLSPDFIVLLSSFSGEFRDGDVQALRSFFPITPVLTILGNWCDGEARTGTPLVGTHSILWYDFVAKAPVEWTSFENNLPTIWSISALSLPEQRALFEQNREERFKSLLYQNRNHRPAQNEVGFYIDTCDSAQFSLLRDIIQRDEIFGNCAKIMGRNNDPDPQNAEADGSVKFLLFDFPDLNDATRKHFYELANRFPKAVWIAFTESPHPDGWRFLRHCGVRAIFSKPFRIMDLRFFCRQF